MLDKKIFMPEEQGVDYQPSESDSTKISYVLWRFEEMKSARTVVDKYRDVYQDMIEAVFVEYPDERSSSVVPLASSMIELYVADAMKIETQFLFKSETSDYQTNAKALEYVWKYDWRKNARKKVFNENEYITAWFGTSVLYTGFEQYEKEQQDLVGIDDNMTLKWEKKTIKKEEIIVKNVDIRNFYVDNHAMSSFDEAVDCIHRERISYDKFKKYATNPLYKNTEYVKPREYSNEYHWFTTEEEMVKQGNYVELLRYRNVEKDAFIVLANGVLVREHPMVSTIDWEKALPFVVRNLGKKNYSIYGRGICEACMMFNSELNNLRELLMDAIRRSNTQVLALGNWLSFDWRSFSYDNEILTFDWNLANNFQQISWNPPNQAIFSYVERIYKDIAMFVWLDIQNIIWQSQQTAFQTEVQREASQKRINVWLLNRDLAYERFANLYKDLLQTYFPRKTAEGVYPKIETEDEKLESNGKFRKKKWKYTFEVTPELLRWDIYIDVYTNTTAPTINAVDREQKLQFVTAIGNIAVGYANAKQAWFDIDTILPQKKILRDMADDFNIELNVDTNNEEVQEAKEKLAQQILGIMPWGQPWQPPLQPNQEQWQQMAQIM